MWPGFSPPSPIVRPIAVMYLQIVEADRQLARRYVVSGAHCWAMWIGLTESRGADSGAHRTHDIGPRGFVLPFQISRLPARWDSELTDNPGPLLPRHGARADDSPVNELSKSGSGQF